MDSKNVRALRERVAVDLATACGVLGIRSTAGYRLAATGSLGTGIRVLRVGRVYRIPTADLRAALGLDRGDAA